MKNPLPKEPKEKIPAPVVVTTKNIFAKSKKNSQNRFRLFIWGLYEAKSVDNLVTLSHLNKNVNIFFVFDPQD